MQMVSKDEKLRTLNFGNFKKLLSSYVTMKIEKNVAVLKKNRVITKIENSCETIQMT